MSVLDDLQHGKLEQTCPDCGRWEAASRRCSWCFRVMGPDDWYRNGLAAEREARLPATVPANPPGEYRRQQSAWPSKWGVWPGVPRTPRDEGTPVNAAPRDPADCPTCGEWRDGPQADCANCGYETSGVLGL